MLAQLGLRPAKDRNGKESRSGLTTEALETALQAYRDAADTAEEAANGALVVRRLCFCPHSKGPLSPAGHHQTMV